LRCPATGSGTVAFDKRHASRQPLTGPSSRRNRNDGPMHIGRNGNTRSGQLVKWYARDI